MGNPPFEDVSPIKKWWFSIAMLVYHRVTPIYRGLTHWVLRVQDVRMVYEFEVEFDLGAFGLFCEAAPPFVRKTRQGR